MPLYEYRCQSCGAEVTVRQSFSEDGTPPCPTCADSTMVRVISRVSIVKSEQDRVSELSWVDRDLAGRIKKKVSGKPNPGLQEALDRMESQ
jgi:putative FmdB family regulatory protein